MFKMFIRKKVDPDKVSDKEKLSQLITFTFKDEVVMSVSLDMLYYIQKFLDAPIPLDPMVYKENDYLKD